MNVFCCFSHSKLSDVKCGRGRQEMLRELLWVQQREEIKGFHSLTNLFSRVLYSPLCNVNNRAWNHCTYIGCHFCESRCRTQSAVDSAGSVQHIQSAQGNRAGLGWIYYHTLVGVLRSERIWVISALATMTYWNVWCSGESRGTSPGRKFVQDMQSCKCEYTEIQMTDLFFHKSWNIEICRSCSILWATFQESHWSTQPHLKTQKIKNIQNVQCFAWILC